MLCRSFPPGPEGQGDGAASAAGFGLSAGRDAKHLTRYTAGLTTTESDPVAFCSVQVYRPPAYALGTELGKMIERSPEP